ncbi:MAG: Trk system potassium transporter TrkA, partial [Halobacteria archaeon]|nr:Trk system potassium transporter TrkA [Halobacteria archaeon]
MHVIIIGAGEVGSSIAASLAESHDVVVVDIDGERVESLQYSLDILALEGDGTSTSVLNEAGIDKADLVIASTDNDETNLVTCSTTKTLSDAFTIARVKKTGYLDTWKGSEQAFGVDFMVCTNLMTAQDIVRIIGTPSALDVEAFSAGNVQMGEFEVTAESPIVNQTVREADRYDSLTFAAILRNGDVEIPGGKTLIEENDKVVVIGSPESVHRFATEVTPEVDDTDEVVIVGGSDIGYQTARL